MSDQDDSGSQTADGSANPWWKKPAFLSAVTAATVGVVIIWVAAGGNAAVHAMFGGESPTRPIVTESVNHDPFCASWLLNRNPEAVGAQIRNQMRGLKDPLGGDMKNRLKAVYKSSGSRLPSGDMVEVIIEGNKESVVVLDHLEVNIAGRSKLGSVMNVGTQCGAGFPARYYAADLDRPRPEFLVYEGDGSGDDEVKPIDFPYKVSSAEPEKFVLVGNTKSVVEWTATLYWTAGGKKGKTEITDGGKPFVSYPELTKLYFDTGTGELHRSP